MTSDRLFLCPMCERSSWRKGDNPAYCSNCAAVMDGVRISRDFVIDFRDYADNPMKGSEFVPIHQSALREAAEQIERLRVALGQIALIARNAKQPENLDEIAIIAGKALTGSL